MRYLLITHIPFARLRDGSVHLDRLWAEDLRGLASAFEAVTVAAPQMEEAALQAWGAGFDTLIPGDRITFVGLPVRTGRLDVTYDLRLRSLLRPAVEQADLVHTSNLFEPAMGLYFAHDYATRLGKKTLFVVAEDFYDMLQWEWVRTAGSRLQRWRRQRTLDRTHTEVCRRVATSSLTFLHTPAAVARYRGYAGKAFAIRQPVHEREDVIEQGRFEAKLDSMMSMAPLRLVSASRMTPLKGVDMLIRAIAILEARGVAVRATLYGEGEQLPDLQVLAERLGVAHSIEFPGPLSSASALREALAENHVFGMAHLTSDFGRAFFDAMAAGCPVIAFRSIASQDTVRDGVDGLLAANADPESLATAIAEFHTDRTLLTGAAAAARTRALENTKTFWNGYRASLVRELFKD